MAYDKNVVLARVYDEMCEGKSVDAICAAKDMPAAATVYRWLVDDEKCEEYARAKTVRADRMADEITTIETTETYLPQSGSLSLTLPAGLPFERWQDIGRELAAREKVLNWWIGDWWAFGEHRYGDRAKAAAEGVFGKAFQTLKNVASVCRAIETSRRRDLVDWSVHAEIAPLARSNPAVAEELMDRAESEGLTVAQVRAAVREIQTGEAPQRPERDDDSLLAGFLHHWNRLPRTVRLSAAELIANAEGEEIEPA